MTTRSAIEDWTASQRWLYAIKPASWPKLLVPMFLGQAIGVAVSGAVSLSALAWGVAFTIIDGVFIVLLNDWGDRDIDAIKRQMFPQGCSPKTIPDGILPAGQLLAGGILAGAALLLLGVLGEVTLHAGLFAASLASVLIFLAYTFPPLKLNYRGGGEALEMLGVGFVLPATNALAQGGVAWSELHTLLFGFAALSLSSALASGLSDEESDRAGGKRTFTTAFGNQATRRAVMFCVGLGLLLWGAAAAAYQQVAIWPVAVAGAVVLFHAARLRASSAAAITNAFGEQKTYKMHLHRLLWYGSTALGTAILIDTFTKLP